MSVSLSRGYVNGAFFLILASLISAINDALMKYTSLCPTDTLFWRFFFATLILLPFVTWKKFVSKGQLHTASTFVHFVRALIFGLSMYLFLVALKKLPLAFITAVNFSIPIWVIILARIFLKEQINNRIWAVLISLFGILITYIPICEKSDMTYAACLIFATIGFASLDVLNKHLVNKNESMLMMLFGSSFWITLLYLPFFSFKIPSNLLYFVGLGIGANLLLFFILQAWKACDISAIQPIKYLEFPISLYLGSVIFKDTSNIFLFIGVGVLISGVLVSIKNEVRKK